MNSEDVKHCFDSGKYADVVAATGRRQVSAAGAEFFELSAMQIGALVFIGEFDEATQLFNRAASSDNVSLQFIVRCRFYLGLGEVRRSNYKIAASLFAQNLNFIRKDPLMRSDSMATFFAYQGVAFFRFYRGHFLHCRAAAQKAYLVAFNHNFEFGQALALDALGQSLCQIGEIRRGLYEMERAKRLCLKLDNTGFATSLEIAMLRFRAQYGIDSKSTIDACKRAIKKLHPQNNFSRSEIYLELTRQYILRGRATEARKLMDEAGETIYKNQNKRQLAWYNHRYAYLLFLRGQPHAALALARSLKSNLDPRMDIVFLRQTAGLEWQIRSALGQSQSELTGIGSVNFIDRRILIRSGLGQKASVNVGEDPIGDLLDRVAQRHEGCFADICELGFLGLLGKVLDVPVGQSVIYLGPRRGSMILFCDGDVLYIERGVSAPMAKMIQILEGGTFKDKRELVEQTWGYAYRGDFHDRLLHATIGKIRKLMGPFSHWLEWSNNGYRIANGIRVTHAKQVLGASDIARLENVGQAKDVSMPVQVRQSELNHRQWLALKAMREGQIFGIAEYSKKFRVCKMTATRDLGALFRSGAVLRIGRGRATKYANEIV